MISEFSIPSVNEKADIFRMTQIIERGHVETTDYAYIKGVNNGSECNYGRYWLSTLTDDYTCRDDAYYGINDAQAVGGGMYSDYAYSDDDSIATKLMVDYDDIVYYGSNEKNYKDGIKTFEYGEYPQTKASYVETQILDNLESSGNLNKTGKRYAYNIGDVSHGLTLAYDEEYEYNGQKYVKAKITNSKLVLPDFEKHRSHLWIKVEPIVWYTDYNKHLAVTGKNIIGGVQYNIKPVEGLNNTFLKSFIENGFKKDISNIYTQVNTSSNNVKKKVSKSNSTNNSQKNQSSGTSKQNKNTFTKPNPFKFDASSEEDIMRAAIESDLPVFLHGKSSDGKSARVKQIDPDCTIIYLRNATPEVLNGRSICVPGTEEIKDIKPTWLVKLEEKCKNEPDKIHILFFDEISNALPSIQGMAFNIVLDKEVNGKWKLPDNSRIVAAGNEVEDSLSANEIAEPLFNRFVHVYIRTNLNNWLIWASDKDIHPYIYTYMVNSKGRYLRTDYNGEKPNADPRKWEMASKMLYKTGNPLLLRGLLGEDVARDFANFCKNTIITVDDVLNEKVTAKDVKNFDIAQKTLCVNSLSQVKEGDLDEIREFVTTFGPELTTLFDKLWLHDDSSRLERLQEAQMVNRMVLSRR